MGQMEPGKAGDGTFFMPVVYFDKAVVAANAELASLRTRLEKLRDSASPLWLRAAACDVLPSIANLRFL